jgi:hypothetical protein
MPAEPGTKVVNETSTERVIDGLVITETVIEWNATNDISVDYETSAGVFLWEDREVCTSFDGPLSDEELRALLSEYAVST